jgi:hypothetical protein
VSAILRDTCAAIWLAQGEPMSEQLHPQCRP